MLNSGKKAIINTAVTSKGEISLNGNIRHWVVIEEIIRMGSGGWVRVYNPFFNQEEVYPYRNIFDTGSSSSLGLWVDVK
jgi:predicted ATP-dependent serine protease